MWYIYPYYSGLPLASASDVTPQDTGNNIKIDLTFCLVKYKVYLTWIFNVWHWYYMMIYKLFWYCMMLYTNYFLPTFCLTKFWFLLATLVFFCCFFHPTCQECQMLMLLHDDRAENWLVPKNSETMWIILGPYCTQWLVFFNILLKINLTLTDNKYLWGPNFSKQWLTNAKCKYNKYSYQGCTKWWTRRTSPPQADFDRAKKWFQNQAEQTSLASKADQQVKQNISNHTEHELKAIFVSLT